MNYQYHDNAFFYKVTLMNVFFKLRLVLFWFCLFFLLGCQRGFGPNALHNVHSAYNQVIAQSLNEQLLLNIVKLRYYDKPYFLKVGSVTAALALDAKVGVGASLGSSSESISPSIGLAYTDKPTLSFQPLQGEDFLKSVLAPVPVESLLVLTQSGWRIERVFGLCVERINHLYNAPSASGPTPSEEPEYADFKKTLKLIRRLQTAKAIEFGSDVDDQNIIKMRLKMVDGYEKPMRELINLLGLAEMNEDTVVNLDYNFLHDQSDILSVRPRSIASIMFYLSQHIDVPQSHLERGLVGVTQKHDQSLFDWRQTPVGAFFQIQSSQVLPENVFLAVPYKGYWFYIADNDLKSKSTFMLLSQLFDLQAGQQQFSGPTLTLPVR